jgi:CheY-like chemotaxis protein
MTTEEQQGLFREFKQGRAARERPESGTGLGLAISQALCHLLGGAISVESAAGIGSTFTVRLPAEVQAAPAVQPRPVSAAGTARDDVWRPAVLVIDHDAGARELVRRVTARLGFRMLEATTASEGYRLAVVHEPVAIVLEVALSGQNGWALLERLGQLPVVGSVPVVVVSVNEDQARSRSLGATAHLRKPVPTQQLSILLKELAARRTAAGAATSAGRTHASAASV